jgi:hypothetical protein
MLKPGYETQTKPRTTALSGAGRWGQNSGDSAVGIGATRLGGRRKPARVAEPLEKKTREWTKVSMGSMKERRETGIAFSGCTSLAEVLFEMPSECQIIRNNELDELEDGDGIYIHTLL